MSMFAYIVLGLWVVGLLHYIYGEVVWRLPSFDKWLSGERQHREALDKFRKEFPPKETKNF